MTERMSLTAIEKTVLLDPDSLPASLSVRGHEFALVEPVVAGYKSAVWRVRDDHGRDRAAKLVIARDYDNRSILQELSLASRLEEYPFFAKFVDVDAVTIPIKGKETQFFCIIEEWIEGLTLRDYLLKQRISINSTFFLHYAKGIALALSALAAKGLRHDDLHDRNVMLRKPLPGIPDSGWSVVVVDTGSLKLSSSPLTKPADDHLNVVYHFRDIYNAIAERKALPRRERLFLASAQNLMRSMLDEDRTVALRDPTQIQSAFEVAYGDTLRPQRDTPTRLTSPFDYISAEHIADDRILVDLFARSCPWLPKIWGPDPCLITGPRGCGKSTILRWLSLRAHLHKEKLEDLPVHLAGFYVSCSSDLQNRLSWLETPKLAERFSREIIHYLNLILTREVLSTLAWVAERDDREFFWGLGKAQETAIHDFIRTRILSKDPPLQGASRLRQSLDSIERSLFECHREMLIGRNLAETTPQTFLGDLSSMLVSLMPFFRSRRIAFLLDDFSIHRLPEPVQIVMNRVIWERRPSHIFKLSSEKHGAVLRDDTEATIDLTREMVEVDCGREFIALDDSDQVDQAQHFAEELLNVRLKAAGYRGTARELLGESHWKENNLARALIAKSGRKNDQYHGLECIADLCSGDVSTLLLVYRRIFDKAHVDAERRERIPAKIQHEAIQSVAREFLEHLQHHFPHGPRMHLIANEFGQLVRQILESGRPIKKGEDRVPAQCPRIEVDQSGSGVELSLTSELASLAHELVRRAVFIEMEPGRSRRHFATTLRWQLRRVYLPAFGAALSKNDAIKWRPEEFKFFLTDPTLACDREWRKRGHGGGPDLLSGGDGL